MCTFRCTVSATFSLISELHWIEIKVRAGLCPLWRLQGECFLVSQLSEAVPFVHAHSQQSLSSDLGPTVTPIPIRDSCVYIGPTYWLIQGNFLLWCQLISTLIPSPNVMPLCHASCTFSQLPGVRMFGAIVLPTTNIR